MNHLRGTCPDCSADVAVDRRGRVMAHGRRRVPLQGEPRAWGTTYGCHGWGKEALPGEDARPWPF